jgi:hypothetical protein
VKKENLKPVTFFIAGVIQGSSRNRALSDQSYRKRLINLLAKAFPSAQIISPYDLHPNSIDYGLEEGKATFLEMVGRAVECDVVIAYLPEASLGTAIEMWESYRAGVPIWTISPMKENWVIRFFSQRIFSSMVDFERFLFAEAQEEVGRAARSGGQRPEAPSGRPGGELCP